MVLVAVELEPEIRFGKTRELFDEPTLEQVQDMAPDGRFLGIESPEVPPVTRLNVGLHFLEELARRVPSN